MRAKVARQAVDAALRLCVGRCDVAALTRGLTSYQSRSSLAWEDYCVLLNRMVPALGGPAELERLTEESYLEGYPRIRAMMRRLISPGFFLHVSAAIGAQFFPVRFSTSRLEDNLIHWRVELESNATTDSFWLFLGSISTARAASLQLGMPANQVDAVISGRSGEYWIRTPASLALSSQAFASGRRALSSLIVVDEDEMPAPELSAGTLKQIRAFGERLANAADPNQMVAIALEEVGNMVGGEEVVLWRRRQNGSRLEPIARRGNAPWDSPMAAYALRLAGHEFGRIDVRGGGHSKVLEALVPWLSMAFAHVLTQRESANRTLGERLEDVRSRFRLTTRQQEVLELAANGMTNKEIAIALQLSTKTVEFHLQHVFSKTSAQSRAQLARLLFNPLGLDRSLSREECTGAPFTRHR